MSYHLSQTGVVRLCQTVDLPLIHSSAEWVTCDIRADTLLARNLKNSLAKFQPNAIRNEGALGFFWRRLRKPEEQALYDE